MYLYNEIIKSTFLNFLKELDSSEIKSREKFVLYTEFLIENPSDLVNKLIKEELEKIIKKQDNFKQVLKKKIDEAVESIEDIKENTLEKSEKIYGYYDNLI